MVSNMRHTQQPTVFLKAFNNASSGIFIMKITLWSMEHVSFCAEKINVNAEVCLWKALYLAVWIQ